LSPTYRIVLGIPGESHALDIAARNGLPAHLVAGARHYLQDERTDVSAMISGLMDKHRDLDQLKREGRVKLQQALDEQRKADLKELMLKQKELELRRQGVQELKHLLSESRKTLENLVREIREGELTREKTQAVKEFLNQLDQTVARSALDLAIGEAALRSEQAAFDASTPADLVYTGASNKKQKVTGHTDANTKKTRPSTAIPKFIEPGVSVLVLPARRRGIVVRAGKNGQWVVETDALRLMVDAHNLELVQPLAEQTSKISVEGAASFGKRAVLELDLRGMRLQEAILALEEQLDAAVLQNILHFAIIHGTGEGILQQGVREVLSRTKAVRDFHYARPEQGGHGKTLVQLG
jgi:DNA mismatch repair protein MutS2